jgi:hypothetical protein
VAPNVHSADRSPASLSCWRRCRSRSGVLPLRRALDKLFSAATAPALTACAARAARRVATSARPRYRGGVLPRGRVQLRDRNHPPVQRHDAIDRQAEPLDVRDQAEMVRVRRRRRRRIRRGGRECASASINLSCGR